MCEHVYLSVDMYMCVSMSMCALGLGITIPSRRKAPIIEVNKISVVRCSGWRKRYYAGSNVC